MLITLTSRQTGSADVVVDADPATPVRDIVKNLLQFSRQAKVDLEPNDINEIITQSLRFVTHFVKFIEVEFCFWGKGIFNE